MRLGIPGSTATVFPDPISWSRDNMGAERVNVTAPLVAGHSATATVHMAQHFMQP